MEIGVGIQEGYSIDKGKAVARLDKDSMKQIEASNCQIIEIQGNRRTCAKCFPSTESMGGNLKIDSLIRHNAQIQIGARIYIKKINPPEAKKVQVVPLEITHFGDDAEVKERLLGCPIVQGDIIAIESMKEFSYFRVEKTDAQGPCVIMPGTDFEIGEYLFITNRTEEHTKETDELTEQEFNNIKANFEK